MEIHQLRYFAKVAELGNFTRAAEACFVSQPSLSQQIIKLEQELGQPLLERLGRTVRLTKAGEILKPRADQILALLDDAKSRITDDPDGGHLSIAAIPTVAPYFLPHVLQEFSHECPGAHLEVVEEVTRDALAHCHAGEVDLAIVALPVQGEHLHVEPLFSEELLLVMPAGHPLDSHARITLKDLAQQPFVLLHDTHCLTRDALSACHRQNFQPIVAAHISQLITVQELVSLGQGVSLVPQMARVMDQSPTRCYRSLSGEQPVRTIALVWHEQRFQSKLFKRFVEWLRRRCAGEGARAEKR